MESLESRFVTAESILSYKFPLLDDVGNPFGRIGSFHIFFYLVFFYPILGHNAALSLLY